MSNEPAAPAGFRIDIVRVNGHARLRLAGDIDVAARESLHEAIASVLVDGHELVLDLRDVTFLDSTGIGAIARAVNEGADVFAVEVPPIVRRTLEVSGLDHYIHVDCSDQPQD